MNYASFNIGGRLVRDPEIKDSRGGPVCTFAIAVNRKQKGEDVASFFDCVMFGEQAENFARFHSRGDAVFVIGEPVQERWEKDGQKRSKVVFKAYRWVFVGSKSDREQSRQAAPQPQQQTMYARDTASGGYGDNPGGYSGDDDTPF